MMKRTLGFVLMMSGWPIAIAAVALLDSGPAQLTFMLAALLIQAGGLTFIARSSLPLRGRAR